jgi:hypothetical protein
VQKQKRKSVLSEKAYLRLTVEEQAMLTEVGWKVYPNQVGA